MHDIGQSVVYKKKGIAPRNSRNTRKENVVVEGITNLGAGNRRFRNVDCGVYGSGKLWVC